MRRLTVVFACVFASGCEQPQAQPDCDAVGIAADKVLQQALRIPAKDLRSPGTGPNIFRSRCIEDAWPIAMRQCIADAQAGADLKTCERHLTAAQRDKLETAAARGLQDIVERSTRGTP